MMPWIVKSLWLIPVLSLLAAGMDALAQKYRSDYTFAT